MAELLDTVQEPTPTKDPVPEPTLDDVATPVIEEAKADTQDEDLPEKYKGKSAAELVRMHQEAEKALGRKGSEVGELRKVVDSYIQTNMSESQVAPQEPADETTVDWFDDPDKALEQRIANDPRLKAFEEQTEQSRRAANMAALESKHPDFKDVISDNEFAEWVMKSKIRTKLFVEADQKYDTDAADELLTTFKERKSMASQTVQADKTSRKDAAKAASTGGTSGSSTPKGTKKYRRADIIKLMTEDPERYQALQPEILKAYAEKRVV